MRPFAYPWLLALLAAGCGSEGITPSAYDYGLPAGFPQPREPEDNATTEAKVTLGRFLFYDTRLSLNEEQSCALCHRQELAFTDGLARSVGSTGERHPRGSMSLAGAGYLPRLTWANPLLDSLEEQALLPLFGEQPVELGFSGREDDLLRRLQNDARYPDLFAAAFPETSPSVSVRHIVQALGAFQRTLISANTPYDQLVYGGDQEALSPSALRGADLFFGERLECFHCHGGFNFAGAQRHDGNTEDDVTFHNTGLYNLDGFGRYPDSNQGVLEISLDPRDMGKFRAPTLRNIAVTAPYFHDGSAATLDEVLDHYAAGGREIVTGPFSGDGSRSPIKSIFVQGFTLSEEEREDILSFLRALTDDAFLTDERFADPFAGDEE